MSSNKYEIIAECYNKKGKLLSVAKNNYRKTHPLQAHFAKLVGENERIFLHAEIAALIKAGITSSIEYIKVSRHNREGTTRIAKPCRVCQAAAKAFGIKRIIFTTNSGDFDVMEI